MQSPDSKRDASGFMKLAPSRRHAVNKITGDWVWPRLHAKVFGHVITRQLVPRTVYAGKHVRCALRHRDSLQGSRSYTPGLRKRLNGGILPGMSSIGDTNYKSSGKRGSTSSIEAGHSGSEEMLSTNWNRQSLGTLRGNMLGQQCIISTEPLGQWIVLVSRSPEHHRDHTLHRQLPRQQKRSSAKLSLGAAAIRVSPQVC